MHLAALADEVAVPQGDVPAVVEALGDTVERFEVPVRVQVSATPKDCVDALGLDEFAAVLADDSEPPGGRFHVMAPVDAARVHWVVVSRQQERLAVELCDRFRGELDGLGRDAVVVEKVSRDH